VNLPRLFCRWITTFRALNLVLCGAIALCGGTVYAQREQPQAGSGEYVGQYRWTSDVDTVMAVYRDGRKLYEDREGRQRRELIADKTADRFDVAGMTSHIEFHRDAGGVVTGLRIVADNDGRVLEEARRISTADERISHYRPYMRQDVMIPMRDGVRLHAVVLRPTETADLPGNGIPFLMDRTPYGVDDSSSESVNQSKPELAASGYIFVYEDIRGRYKSEGTFVMNRPIVAHLARTDVDETTDSSDTVDWLLRNVQGNNGRAGVLGVSYDGFLAMMAGIDSNPAVKAISPQAPMTDVWMGDDFFHNGAFRESYGFDYVQGMEVQKTFATVDMKQDMFDFFLKQRNFADAAKSAGMSDLPTARAFLNQPEYTKFWQDMAVQDRLAKVTVPTLEVGGFWDQEDMWGTQAEYAALKAHDPQTFLVLGPWRHGGWDGPARDLGSEFGRLDFGEPTGTEYRKMFETPFFEKYLKDRPGFDLTNTAAFRTGINRWERYDTWPPKSGFAAADLYLEPGGALSFAAAPKSSDGVAARYVADPADPVPYRHRPIQSTYAPGSKWYTWLVEDQSFVTGRKDVASFTTPPLDHDVTITGDVTADLFAATTGSDADWIVKLIDVSPDDAPVNPGYQLMVADEIFRGRYQASFEHPEALTPNAVNEFRWSLHGVDHTFLKGHRMMVEVQSSWFPLYDRNPQTFVPNIMTAAKKAYQKETVTIYGSDQYPSRIEFPVAR
jgi:putative CocE/NonD family hydrolase